MFPMRRKELKTVTGALPEIDRPVTQKLRRIRTFHEIASMNGSFRLQVYKELCTIAFPSPLMTEQTRTR